MAKNGLSTFLYADRKKDGTYGEVKKLAAAISYKESLTKNSGSTYADNIKQFEDNSVTGGTLTLELLDDDPAIFNPLLGKKKKEVGGKEVYVGNAEDLPIENGFGFIENEKVEGGKLYYRVRFYYKVTFSPYDKEGQTRKESTEYKNPTVTGTIYVVDNGDYDADNRYETMEEAIAVLYALFGAEVPAADDAQVAQVNADDKEEE